MQKTRIAIGVATVCLLVTTAFAQSDSSQISGFVKDPSGSIVPNVTVTVTNEATNQERKVQTNESGYYVATNIRPGFYTISAEATGFKKFVKTGNKLDASLPLTVDVTLDVGAVTETVEVVASTATVQSDTATVGRLVERSQIENMMLNGRNPMWLAQLKAGVRSGQSLARFNYDLNNDLQINGGRTQDFAMSFDGAVAIRTRANGTRSGWRTWTRCRRSRSSRPITTPNTDARAAASPHCHQERDPRFPRQPVRVLPQQRVGCELLGAQPIYGPFAK